MTGWTHPLRCGATGCTDPSRTGPHNRSGQDVDHAIREATSVYLEVMGDRLEPDDDAPARRNTFGAT